MTTTVPRGIRNNNPGNIRGVAGTVWQGQSMVQNDGAFVQFDNPVYGIRAIARILKSYEREGLDTVSQIINRWAPANENNSEAYVEAVCKECAVGASTVISISSMMGQIIKAIIEHENGYQPYTDEQINEGVSLA